MEGINVKRATKFYGYGKSTLTALNNCSTTIPHNGVYGLLGPSGCGKTTLLRAILGSIKLNSGEVTICGSKPGAKGLHFPGRNVGYMPQDLALYYTFSIREIFIFHGWINEMSFLEIKKRSEFLVKLLELPSADRIIETLSGGQKRRVSFAVALLHQPQYMILDEPTVGVDPLLRAKIWSYLFELIKVGKNCIILTTHYIEEARKAQIVGLMRNGTLLKEGNPEDLITQYNATTLEAVFLSLCRNLDCSENIKDTNLESIEVEFKDTSLVAKPHNYHITKYIQGKVALFFSTIFILFKLPDFNKIAACVYKELVILKTNPLIMFFAVLFPVVEVCIFLFAIGSPPKDLPVAIVNQESPQVVSKIFLDELSKSLIQQVNYSSYEAALKAGKDADVIGIVHIGSEFSSSLIQRYQSLGSSSQSVITKSQINISLDLTEKISTNELKLEFSQAFQRTMESVVVQYNLDESILEQFLNFVNPLYGSDDISFTDYMAPGLIICLLFGFQAGHVSVHGVIERNFGLIDRAASSGVKTIDLTIGFLVIQVIILSIQVFLSVLCTFYLFGVALYGSVIAVYFYCLIQGWVGIGAGLAVAAVCDTETSAVQLGMTFVYPTLFLSGSIWPVESIPYPFRYLSYVFPQTFAGIGLRGIFLKGWSFFHPKVLFGFIVSVLYIGVLMVFTVFVGVLKS